MKRPEYVAAAVNACRVKLAGGAPDTASLKSVFSRGGFTDGYLTGRVNGAMFGRRTKEDVTAAAGVLKNLQRLYDKEYPRVPVDMALAVPAAGPAVLRVSDGVNEAAQAGPAAEPALTAPLTPEKAAQSLEKLGGTPYFARLVTAEVAPGVMLPASALNALRRGAVEKLTALRAETPPVKNLTAEILRGISGLPFSPAPEKPALRMRFQTAAQAFSLPECERVILPLYEIAAHPALAERFGGRLAAEIPVLLFPADEEDALLTLQKIRALGVNVGVAENIGAVRLLRQAGFTVTGGAHLNITNRLALSQLEGLGCMDNTLSFELHFGDIRRLRCAGKTGYIAYGRTPLMRFRACPQRGENGCGSCGGSAWITDRKNERFPLLCERRRYSTMLNAVPLCAVGLPEPPADFRTLYFTVETPAECKEIAGALLAGRKPCGPLTAGQYNKKLL